MCSLYQPYLNMSIFRLSFSYRYFAKIVFLFFFCKIFFCCVFPFRPFLYNKKKKDITFLLSYRGKMRKKKIPLLYHCTIFMLYYVCDLLTMPEDDEILKNGTVDFVSISYYSSNCVSVTQKGKITAANGGENIKNPYLETSAWGWQIDVLLVQKSH